MIRYGYFSISKNEIRELAIAWAVITLVFTLVLRSSQIPLFLTVLMSIIGVGIAFLLHELAHKIVAQHYGCRAEFRAFKEWLGLSVLLALLGVVFIAPGAVFISGPVGKRRNGTIAAAGPITNIVLALLFLPLTFSSSAITFLIAQYAVTINLWLALFNMIPFGPLDGKKVWVWNKAVYIVIVAVTFLLMNRQLL